MWKKFLAEVHATKSASTYRNYVNALSHFETGSVEEIMSFLESDVSDTSKVQYLAVLKVALEYYGKLDWKKSRIIKGFRANKKVQPCPTNEEVEKVYRDLSNLRDRVMYDLMAYNGLRVSEVANLDISDIHADTIVVRNTKGKRDAFMEQIRSIKSYLVTRDTAQVLVNREMMKE